MKEKAAQRRIMASYNEQAANMFPATIQRMGERAVSEGWDRFSFRRDFRVPLSIMSHVLFTAALRLPDDGFTTVPPHDENHCDANVIRVSHQEDLT